ncbi:flagellar hook-associated protein FlgK [Petralouisia muris]|uniref:Flagellar hook-associated protein FlgK n=1 Tax=Petralouisia muris TaxID=3032872 RepID=A0AC61RTW2_9FIRM|nr:flagellar hook-associated protein FlgK [Petralouisia muris]TGY95146.1 flagellar hook-associated protein FlgK [Petralouisia muris]
MPSTFFGLTIAGSALNSFHAATNTVANNISNVNTKGYTRQEAVRVAAEALRTNQRYGMVGSGVTTTEIIQKRDFYYDVKYWENNARVGMYDTKLYGMQQIEDFLLDDDSAKGFTTILNEMFSAMEDLQKTPESLDARKAFISKSQNFVNFFNSMNVGLTRIQEDFNQEIAAQVANINSIGQKIALLNKQINVIELQGTNANELRDQRALLVDQLSELVPVEVIESPVANSNYPDVYTGATNYVLKINGQTLVENFEYNTLECQARNYKVNQSDAEGLYEIRWSHTGMEFNASGKNCTGRLKALFDIRDGNNNEAFQGRIDSFTAGNGGSIVSVKNPSITSINGMTMPSEGVITLGNKNFAYSGFTYNAETQTYEFQLKTTLSVEEQNAMNNRSAVIGSNIDAMGVPYYQAQANNFIREFAKQFNLIHKSGVDLNGNEGKSFFVAKDPTDGTEYNFDGYHGMQDMDDTMTSTGNYYYLLTASSVKVDKDLELDPRLLVTMYQSDLEDDVASQDIVEKMLTLKSEVTMFRGVGADQFLACLISDNTVDTQKAKNFLESYTNINETIIQKRMSISGVDEDEEALDMLKFQNAYNLASRMIQTMTEMYDRLILETGV